jgi:hypothetical protein
VFGFAEGFVMLNEISNGMIERFAKQIPTKVLFGNLASPEAEDTGRSSADTMKALRLVLVPVQAADALQDRLAAFLDRCVRRIPEERRISPAPQILGPVLEAIRYEPEGTLIDKMLSQLLSSAMDRHRVNTAHPAFPGIVKQLSSDEAKILTLVSRSRYRWICLHHFNRHKQIYDDCTVELNELPLDAIMFPANVPIYMQHLDLLGLAWMPQIGHQEIIFAPMTRLQTASRQTCEYQLKEWGRQFVDACLPPNEN